MEGESYWHIVWQQYKKNKIGVIALIFLSFFFAVGLYAPLFASSKPLLVYWNGHFYSPLLRYMLYAGFYTKPIDLFFNLLMITLPVALIGCFMLKGRVRVYFFWSITLIQLVLFIFVYRGFVKNPANDVPFAAARREAAEAHKGHHEDPLLAPISYPLSWKNELSYLSPYTQLNQILEYRYNLAQQNRLAPFATLYAEKQGHEMPTRWQVWERNLKTREEELVKSRQEVEANYQLYRERLPELMQQYRNYSHDFIMAKFAFEHARSDEEKTIAEARLNEAVRAAAPFRTPLVNARHAVSTYEKSSSELSYLHDKKEWLKNENAHLKVLIPPLIRTFHWEEDAGGAQEANQYVPWWELTRINRKDLFAGLLFGIRVSIVVGTLAVLLSLFIGIPFGLVSGYFAGKTDLVVCRIIEMWEAMPTFFMLLLVVAITHSKSIFMVIAVLGFFGWTGFARFIRSEVLRQRKLPYVEACRSLGFKAGRIMFSHVLPNAIPPVLTLLPFAMMAAITSEAGLSFLGLGEEGSTSWGVLMDEGRGVFPAESYLLWPPAILLTLLLISIALVGDALRDAIDPKMR